MACSVRIEDEAFSDGRYEHLGVLMGTSKFDALGRMTVLWRQCTQEKTYVLSESFVRVFVDPEKLIESRLGEKVPAGIRIKGTKGRIEWLAKLRKNGKKGGRPRKPNGYGLVKPTQTISEPDSNPPAPAPAPAPTIREESGSPDGLALLFGKADMAGGEVGQARNAKAVRKKAADNPDHQAAIDAFHVRYKAKYGTKPDWNGKSIGLLSALIKRHPLGSLIERMDFMFSGLAKWPQGPYSASVFVQHFDRWVDERPAPVTYRKEIEL